jgi:hypothetical protein
MLPGVKGDGGQSHVVTDRKYGPVQQLHCVHMWLCQGLIPDARRHASAGTWHTCMDVQPCRTAYTEALLNCILFKLCPTHKHLGRSAIQVTLTAVHVD